MRVVLFAETFSKKMGYLQNCLPRSMARLGIDMHVVTLDLPPYYQNEAYRKAFDTLAPNDLVAGTTEDLDGYKLHVIGHTKQLGYMRGVGLEEKIRELKPDIVQTMAPIGWIPMDLAILQPKLNFKLFTASHYTAYAFPLSTANLPKWHPQMIKCFLLRTLPGRFVSKRTVKFYGATVDCTEVAVGYFGVAAEKAFQSELGVDTDILYPVTSEADQASRANERAELGVQDHEVLCIYTGRFFEEKNPLVLAKAIDRLQKAGEPFRGLFIGDGDQRAEIEACKGCVVRPFRPFKELGHVYRSAELGCWPQSDSMAVLDCAACGLPVVVMDRLPSTERYEGNGVTYEMGNDEDLARVLVTLKDPARRKELGDFGAKKMREKFSWDSMAQQRIADYKKALGK